MDTLKAASVGIVIVTFGSRNDIVDCLESVFAESHDNLKVVVCDNASPDDTCEVVVRWAATRKDFSFEERFADESGAVVDRTDRTLDRAAAAGRALILVRDPQNRGFAGGVNVGLRFLLPQQCEFFWILNPDCVIGSGSLDEFLGCAGQGSFSVIGGRILFYKSGDLVQADGGRVLWWSGRGNSINNRMHAASCRPPQVSEIDYIIGASMFVSREFVDRAGLMAEEYFLYHEEVDWCLRRANLPLKICESAIVFHKSGTSIGSNVDKRKASPLSVYFNFRNRLRFLARWGKRYLIPAYLFALAEIANLIVRGALPQAIAAFRGLHQLLPPESVRRRLSQSNNTFLPAQRQPR